MLKQCRYVYNTDTENYCSPFVSPFDALPNHKRVRIMRSYLFTCGANKNMPDWFDPIVSNNSGHENDVRNGVHLEGGSNADPSKRLKLHFTKIQLHSLKSICTIAIINFKKHMTVLIPNGYISPDVTFY